MLGDGYPVLFPSLGSHRLGDHETFHLILFLVYLCYAVHCGGLSGLSCDLSDLLTMWPPFLRSSVK
jgi:hypothetical protein